MIAYASRTGTQRNLDAMWAAGWRLLVNAAGVLRCEGFRYGVDNGAWTDHQAGVQFDEPRFLEALERFGPGADFVVAPDIVAGGLASLDLSRRWLPRVLNCSQRALIAVQDGMSEADVAYLLDERVGLFVGGSTAWKLATLDRWCRLGRQAGCWVHVGRVNSARRIHLCGTAGATSFDGTSVTRYAVTLPKLDNARRQSSLNLEYAT